MVNDYNAKIKAIYNNKLKEKVLDALAYHTSASHLKKQLKSEAS